MSEMVLSVRALPETLFKMMPAGAQVVHFERRKNVRSKSIVRRRKL